MTSSPIDEPAFLHARFHPRTVDRIESGTWSRAYKVSGDDEILVVRFGARLEDYLRDRVASTWSSDRLPIPEVLEVGEVEGTAFAVSRYVQGVPLESIGSNSWHAAIPSLIDALDALADVRPVAGGFGRIDGDGGAPHISWAGWLIDSVCDEGTGRVAGFRDALAEIPGALHRYERSVERFRDTSDCWPEIRSYVHTDLGAGNTLIDDHGRVTGIIDWANTIIGDPLYDLAHLTFWAPWHPGCPEEELRSAATARNSPDGGPGPDADRRIRAYELHLALLEQQYNAVAGRPGMLDEIARRIDQLTG